MSHVPFNCTLQVSGTVLHFRTFKEKSLFRSWCNLNQEPSCRPCGEQNASLNKLKFNLQNLAEVLVAQRSEHDGLVNAVHKFRRELASRGLNGCTLNLVVKA